jgi:hypothetical protein
MHTLLGELASHATVIIDAPPLLSVTDGAVLAHQADGALLVLRAGKTTYDLAEKALEALHKAHGRTLGLVLNRVPLRGIDASPYAYAYRKSYSQAANEQTATTITPESAPTDGNERLTTRIRERDRSEVPPVSDVDSADGDASDEEMHKVLGALLDDSTERRPRKPRDRIRRS